MALTIPFESEFEKKLKEPDGIPVLPKPKNPTPIFPQRGDEVPVAKGNEFTDLIPVPNTGSKSRDIEINLNQRDQIDQYAAAMSDQFLSERQAGETANITPFNRADFRESFNTDEIDVKRLEAQANAVKGPGVPGLFDVVDTKFKPFEAEKIDFAAIDRKREKDSLGVSDFDQELAAIQERIKRHEARMTARQTASFREKLGGVLGSFFILEDAALEGAVGLVKGRGVAFPNTAGILKASDDFSQRPAKEQIALGFLSPSKGALGEQALRTAARGVKEAAKLTKQSGALDEVRKFLDEETGSIGPSDAAKPVDPPTPVQGIKYTGEELVKGAESPVDVGNRFIGYPTHIKELAKEVITTTNKIVNLLIVKTGIQPAMAKNTEVGRLTVAYQRAMVNADTMTDAALITAFDSHATPFAGNLGRLLPIDSKGIWKGTDRHVLSIMEDSTGVSLTKRQTEMLTDMRKVVLEVEQMRVAHGLTPLARNADGTLYFPRRATGRDGLEFQRPSNPAFERIFEDMKDGIAAGVDYSNNPRKVLEAHMKRAYRDIALKQLDSSVKPFGLTPKALLLKMKPEVVKAYADTITPLRHAQQMVRALEKQKLVLTVTGPSESASRLRNARTKKLAQLEEQLGVARENVKQTQKSYNTAKRNYSKELKRVKTTSITKGKFFGQTQENINIVEWKKHFYPIKDADFLKKGIDDLLDRPDRSKVFTAFRTTGNAVRALASTADAALPLTHGILVLFRDPAAWAKGSLHHYYAFFDPAVQGRYAKKYPVDIREAGEAGIAINKNEYHAINEQGGNIDAYVRSQKGGNVVANVVRAVKGQTLGRFQAMYDTGLMVYRIEMWRGLKAGWKGSPRELASYINNLTGGLDTRNLGVGVKQADVESMWLAFSPRLLRSTVAVFGDAFQAITNTVRPGVKATAKQRQSFQVLATTISGVMGIVVTVGIALGKSQEEIKTALNPLEGKKFCAYEINGDWIGCGGQVRALIQGMFALAEVVAPGGRGIEELLSTDLRENPILAFAAGRGAVGANIAGAIIEGASGGKINALKYDEVDNVADVARHIGKSALPFVIQGGLEGENALTLKYSFSGFRTSPETFTEERNRVTPDILTANGMSLTNPVNGEKLGWKDIPPRLQKDVDEIVESTRKERDPRQTDIDARISVAFETARETKIAVADRLGETIESDPGATGVRKAIQAARKELFVVNRALFNERVQAELDERKQDETLLEALRTQYWTASGDDSPDTNDQWYSQRDEVREAVLRSGREQGIPQAFIEQRAELTDDKFVQSFLDKYDTDQELLGMYWESPNLMVRDQLPEDVQIVWDQYIEADRINQAAIIAEFPGMRNVIKLRSDIRRQLRVADPMIDVALIRWGYVSEPLTVEGQKMAQSLLR